MQYSISEAARIVGVTRKTLYKHIDNKPISVSKDTNGRPVIDASELIRVYGDKCHFGNQGTQKETAQSIQSSHDAVAPSTVDDVEAAVIKKELELLKLQISHERDQHEAQLEHLKEALSKSQETTQKVTMLLEDQRKRPDHSQEWQAAIRILEKKIANQEEGRAQEKERTLKMQRQAQAFRKALEVEKNKSIWQKLFG